MAKIKELQKKYELSKDDFWNLTGNVWIILHDAVEKIANKENIIFQLPTLLRNDKDSVAFLGTAILKDNEIWATGEASLSNCKVPYPFAMAEKRLKDRLTLKLINAYEYGIYSDVESDQFKKQ